MAGFTMIGALCSLLLFLGAQDPDLQRDYRRLQQRLLTGEGYDERLEILRGFLERHEAAARDRCVLVAQLQLAGMLLERLQATQARKEFAAVLEMADRDDHAVRGRALYGVAQALELENKTDEARSNLQKLIEEHEGTRYARFARVAKARLRKNDRSDQDAIVPGRRLPRLHLGEDLQGRPVRASELRGAPVLLVFFAPDHDASRFRLEALHRVWRQAGQPAEHLIAYALSSDPQELHALADRSGWAFPILRAHNGFLHHDLLALGVTGIPSSFLIGAEGRLLAMDLPPDRLAELLDRAFNR